MEFRRYLPRRSDFHLQRSSAASYATCITSVAGAVVAGRWIGEFVANSARGLDASDESYYLLAVQYPHTSSTSASGFDSYLALVWRLCFGSIERFRLAGLLILLATVALTAALCARALLLQRRTTIAIGSAMAVGLASLTLTFYSLGIPTPGYNMVVLVVTLCIVALTARLALEGKSESPDGSGDQRRSQRLLAGLAFALTIGLVAKGPAFLLVGLLSGIAIMITCGPKWLARQWKYLAAGFGGGVLLFIALTGLPVGIAQRTFRGLRANRLLGSHTSEALWELTSMRDVYGPWLLRFLIGGCLLRLAWHWIRDERLRLVIICSASLLTAFWFARSLPGGGPTALKQGAGWWWIRFTAMMLLWATASAGVTSRKLALGPLIALMAIGAGAGSGNGVFREVAMTVGVLAVALLVQAVVVARLGGKGEGEGSYVPHDRYRLARFLPVGVFFLVGSLASNHVLTETLDHPYRLLGSLGAENETIDLGTFGTIDVNPETARYVRELQAIGARVPAKAKDCLVDLAGGTPLSAMALGMKPATVPWVVGGYPGSNEFADYVLKDSQCLAGGFVLIEAPGGVRAIARPGWLDTSGEVLLGRVRYRGYLNEEQLVWLVPGSSGP